MAFVLIILTTKSGQYMSQIVEKIQHDYGKDKWGQRLGIEICELIQDESIQLVLPFRQTNMNLGGRMHGGVIASLLVDSAKLLAHASCIDKAGLSWRVIDFQVNYLKAGGPEPLTAVAHVTKRTREFLFCRCEVLNSGNEVLAISNVLIRIYSPGNILPPTVHQQTQTLSNRLTAQEIADAAPNKSLITMFNQMMEPLYPGSVVHYMLDGHAEMIQHNFADQYDFQGNIALGQLLLFFDNVSGCSGGSLAEEMGIAVTLTIQSTFCEPSSGENLIGISNTFYREDGMTHNDVKIFGETSQRLKMFGTMTHLARPFKKS